MSYFVSAFYATLCPLTICIFITFASVYNIYLASNLSFMLMGSIVLPVLKDISNFVKKQVYLIQVIILKRLVTNMYVVYCIFLIDSNLSCSHNCFLYPIANIFFTLLYSKLKSNFIYIHDIFFVIKGMCRQVRLYLAVFVITMPSKRYPISLLYISYNISGLFSKRFMFIFGNFTCLIRYQ